MTGGSGDHVFDERDTASRGLAPQESQRGGHVLVQVGLLELGVVEPHKVAKVLDDLLDSFQALARSGHERGHVVEHVGQVHLLGQGVDIRQELMLVLLEGSLGLLIEADQVMKVAHVALEKGDIVGDEGQRIVDLMSDAGDHLAQRRESLRLDELGFRPLELLVGDLQLLMRDPDRVGRAAQVVGRSLQLIVSFLQERLRILQVARAIEDAAFEQVVGAA